MTILALNTGAKEVLKGLLQAEMAPTQLCAPSIQTYVTLRPFAHKTFKDPNLTAFVYGLFLASEISR